MLFMSVVVSDAIEVGGQGGGVAPMSSNTIQSLTLISGNWFPVTTVSRESNVGPNTVDP
jgi:hypothetical protein